MNVTISFLGRFWAFNLANQLSRRGHLHKLITSYPSYEPYRYGVPRKYIRSLPHYEVLNRLSNKIPSRIIRKEKLNNWIKGKFEKTTANYLDKETEIFVGLSGVSELGIEKSKKYGCIAVLERGSTHIEEQRRILKEEGKINHTAIDLPHKKVIRKEKREYKKADKIVVPSKFVKKSFIKNGLDSSKVIRIPYGVSTNKFHQVEKNDDTFRVVFVGTMCLRKGVHYLLKAFFELDLPESELLLIGPKKDEINKYFKKYKECFRYLGHKPQDELYKYYSQGSVFTMCSVEEGLAMVQAQAMACGLPLICTSNTGGGDLVREGEEGFVIPIRDVNAIKDRIRWCYDNQDKCRNMGLRAKQRIREMFTWDHYGDRVEKRYKEIMGA